MQLNLQSDNLIHFGLFEILLDDKILVYMKSTDENFESKKAKR